MQKDRALESVKAFLPNDNEIETIIKVCDLYPVENSWRKWTDHLGSYIQIHNNKKIVSFAHSPYDKSERIATDLYFKSPPETISKLSEWAFISFGKNNEDILNICFIWFLGANNRLRLLSYSNNKWQRNYPPLISGIDTLRPIIRSFDIASYRQADILRIQGPLAANMVKSWATAWPPCDKFVDKIMDYDLGKKIKELI
ncbi:hypothetical protein LCGC14_0469790 [marine sediment metagenome]|uniref:Uncharacterized protein n=1 Tax=marine sediment metagenome TaxID=412755 RepID=A0A0F9SHV6_9ZZZZ